MDKIALTKQQQEAIDFFNKYNYLVVEAPRRSGKTVLLNALVMINPDKKIGIYCNGLYFFNKHYGMFKNTNYLAKADDIEEYDLLIGDEILLVPNDKKPTACALTKRYITLRWGLHDNPYIQRDQLDEIKTQISDIHWKTEFGQYE